MSSVLNQLNVSYKLLSLYLLNFLSNVVSNTTRVVVSIKQDNVFKVLSIMLVTSYEFRTWLVENYMHLYKRLRNIGKLKKDVFVTKAKNFMAR